jgi:hypothetical protein
MPSYAHIAAAVPTTSPGTTRARYRRLLAEQLGRWQEITVTTEATGGEASRVVIADELRDDEAVFSYPWPDDSWLYVRSGSQAETQRRVLSLPDVGYQGPRSALLLSRPLAAPLAVGTAVELTSPLPCDPMLGVKGLDTLIDEALNRCWIQAAVEIVGNGTDQYDLGLYPFIELDRQVHGISDARWGSSTEARSQASTLARILTDGAERTLVTDTVYGTSSTFWLDVVVRADLLVGPAWAYTTTPGLASDAATAAVPERWVTTIGMVKGLDALQKMAQANRRLDPDAVTRAVAALDRRRRIWAAAAARIKAYEMPKAGPALRAPAVAVAAW